MVSLRRPVRTIFWLSVFAIAMAYLETAIVIYLRELYFQADILTLFPLKEFTSFDYLVELGRETATMIMLWVPAFLVERRNTVRIFAVFVFLFGVWDIFYYIWLKCTIGWPVAWLEWDILFLIPWVWLGPWICPVLISLLFVTWGVFILRSQRAFEFHRMGLFLFGLGTLSTLITFLQPAFAVFLREGIEGVLQFQPHGFWWGLFIPGYFMMIAGLFTVTEKQSNEETEE